jgi:DNA primase
MLSPIDEIKNRLDIVEVIGSYIKLRKCGINYSALCPFHSEKKPSFFVSPTRQVWHCFGCQAGGNIFKFVMMIENVEFGDALRILAQKAGVDLKPQRPELKTKRQRLYQVLEWATKFFEKQLEASSNGKEAKAYLLSRKISEESIKKWRVGYSPNTWQGLTDFLTSKGYKRGEIVEAGLTIKSEQGSFYDRFRGRIMFPIFDLNSQVIGFGGRVFENQKSKVKNQKLDEAKYVNTPNTLLYDKSRVIYGLDRAKMEIRKKDACILVEGYTDCILSHQLGIENLVSTSGTALTHYQLSILKRYSSNLILAFDMDIGGSSATKKGIDLAQVEGFNIKVVTLPEGKDPADLISENPQDWQKLVNESKSILDFYFEIAFSGRDPKTLEGKKEISKILLPVLKRIPNQIEKAHWVEKLARKLGVREKDIEEEMKKVKIENYEVGTVTPAPTTVRKTRKELLEERLASLILKNPQSVNLIDDNKISYFSPRLKDILVNLKKDPNFDFKKSPSEILDFYNYLYLKAELEGVKETETLPEIKFCLKEIQNIEIKSQLDQISREIKKAEEEKDFKKVDELSNKFNQLAKPLLD